MKRPLSFLGYILLGIFSANTVLANETPVMLCSGLHENGSRANVEITKVWHHLEPGMEPDTTYLFSFTYIGENSLGFWNHAGSIVKGNFSISNQKIMNAIESGQLIHKKENSSVAYYLDFDLNLSTKEAILSHRSGKPVSFNLSLQCTGNL